MSDATIDSKGAKILLVDDTPANLDVLCALLEEQGYDLALAADGDQALKIAAHMQPDLILLDIMMPHMDGFEVCQKLKQEAALQAVPVIFISARDQVEDIVSGFRVGGVDYITKPFRDEEVLARVKTHLSLTLLKRQLVEKNTELQQQYQTLEKTLHELEETQQQLVMQEKMASLGNLVAGVAHEINTPIGAINSAADVVSRCIDRIEDILNHSQAGEAIQKVMGLLKPNIRIVDEAGKRVAQIVKNLKTFARLDEGEYQEADLHEGLDSTLLLLQAELKDRFDVIKDYGPLPPILCYPSELNQVFMNLLVNAIQATEGHGTIRIETGLDSTHACVKISDTGEGILPENLSKVFDPGFTTKGVGVGTGLGLSICYTILQKHGGSIQVESQTGEGSTFTMRVPVPADGAQIATQ